MSERSHLDTRRSFPEVIRPKALAVFVLVWNVPVVLIFVWALRRSGSSHLFERFCLLEAFVLGIALVAVAWSSRLQQALFLPRTDLAFVRRRLYIGGAFWICASLAALLVMSM
jgi:hypothetical protein